MNKQPRIEDLTEEELEDLSHGDVNLRPPPSESESADSGRRLSLGSLGSIHEDREGHDIRGPGYFDFKLDLNSLSRSDSQNSGLSISGLETREEHLKRRPEIARMLISAEGLVSQHCGAPRAEDIKDVNALQAHYENFRKALVAVDDLQREPDVHPAIRERAKKLQDCLIRQQWAVDDSEAEPSGRPTSRLSGRDRDRHRKALTSKDARSPQSGHSTPAKAGRSAKPSPIASPSAHQKASDSELPSPSSSNLWNRFRNKLGKPSQGQSGSSKPQSPRGEAEVAKPQSSAGRKEDKSVEPSAADIEKAAAEHRKKFENAIEVNHPLRPYFWRYCEGEYSTENLAHLAKIDAYLRIADGKQPGDPLEAGKEVLRQGLTPSQVKEVLGPDEQHSEASGDPWQLETNLSSETRKELMAKFSADDPLAIRKGVEAARANLTHHTENTFNRFLASELYRCYEEGIPLAPPLSRDDILR